MRKIGNIITKGFLEDEILFNVVDSIDSIDDNLPTIIIGFELTKEYFPELNMLDWKIDDKFFWTYGRLERMEKFESNLESFKKLCIDRLCKDMEYVCYPMLVRNFETNSSFLEKMYDLEGYSIVIKPISYMCYLIKDDGTKTIGFSMRDAIYIGFNENEIIERINNGKINKLKYSEKIFNYLKNKYFSYPIYPLLYISKIN